MKTITEQKPPEEILEMLGPIDKVFLVGCGTCATMCHTGGVAEVKQMQQRLAEAGKTVTGWMVVPTTCDELTLDAINENLEAIKAAQAILVLACAFGVQTVANYSDKPALPALNTLFIGKEEGPGYYSEVCVQCGDCVLDRTAGICPIARCAKSLLNGPCGGSVDGRCEVSPDIPCAWQLIYDRLAALGMLERLEEIELPKDWSSSQAGGPRKTAGAK